MEEQEMQKPRVLIVATPSYVRSVGKGYMPDDKQAYESKQGEVELISIDNLLSSRYEIETRPILKPDEGEVVQVYIYDPSEKIYKVPRVELEDSLVKARIIAYAGVLERMGAKFVYLNEESELQEGSIFSTDTQAKGSKAGVSAKLRVATNSESKFKKIARNYLTYSMPDNQPREVTEVELFMRRTGLEKDAALCSWLDVLKEGRLTGTRELSFEATREAESTFKLLGELSGDIKAVQLNVSTDVKSNSHLVEKYTCKLKVTF